jgi:hypothetical protein
VKKTGPYLSTIKRLGVSKPSKGAFLTIDPQFLIQQKERNNWAAKLLVDRQAKISSMECMS